MLAVGKGSLVSGRSSSAFECPSANARMLLPSMVVSASLGVASSERMSRGRFALGFSMTEDGQVGFLVLERRAAAGRCDLLRRLA